MDLHLSGRRALVTGASKGIGRAVAETLAAEGCEVLLTARRLDALEEVSASIAALSGSPAKCFSADLSDEKSRQQLIASVGALDILVNNAGAIPAGSLSTLPDQAWRDAWELKVFGYIALCRLVYPEMMRRHSGVIVNIIGAGGERPDAEYIAGSVGNAGLMALTRALGIASPSNNVRVVGINPGITATSRAQSSRTAAEWSAFESLLPFGRAARASEIAAAAAFLASDRSGYTSGAILTIDGGAVNMRRKPTEASTV